MKWTLLLTLFWGFSVIERPLMAKDVQIIRRVQLDESANSARVIGLETQTGIIYSVGNIDRLRSGIPSVLPKAGDLQKKDSIVLKGGLRLNLRDVDFVYVQDTLKEISESSSQGKHPNIDDNTGTSTGSN